MAEEPDAYNNVGIMYYYGFGTEINLKKASELFQLGIKKGCLSCYNQLGLMYQRGDFFEKDLVHAIYMYEHAASKGIANA